VTLRMVLSIALISFYQGAGQTHEVNAGRLRV
jgi:hypothetical protein